ncbi:hypothetical protein V495_06107 [Pseudogymnoascus sp. VKM F-4514 (FW-929)]|nr:hypothetical protein V495_06107 [Pseudogymnoascus sp. VKM F-4514 (FW-929)]
MQVRSSHPGANLVANIPPGSEVSNATKLSPPVAAASPPAADVTATASGAAAATPMAASLGQSASPLVLLALPSS